MPKKIQMEGTEWGRLTCISCERVAEGGRRYRCMFKCVCGGEIITDPMTVRRGACQSCGCLLKEQAPKNWGKWGKNGTLESKGLKPPKKKPRELIKMDGDRYGRLTCISRIGLDKCKVRCDCGQEIIANVNSVRRGDLKSCGCLRRQTAKTNIGKHNETRKCNRSRQNILATRPLGGIGGKGEPPSRAACAKAVAGISKEEQAAQEIARAMIYRSKQLMAIRRKLLPKNR